MAWKEKEGGWAVTFVFGAGSSGSRNHFPFADAMVVSVED